MITLGTRPESLTLFLTRGADFVAALIADPGPWPDGAMVSLVLRADEDEDPQTWAAVITAERAQWNVDRVAVDAVLDAGRDQVELRYAASEGIELTWAAGMVIGD